MEDGGEIGKEEATSPTKVSHKKKGFEGGGLKLGFWFYSWKWVGVSSVLREQER